MAILARWLSRLYEPSTVLTDLAMGAQTLTYAVLLQRAAESQASRLWVVALSASSLASFAGALRHAVPPDAPPLIREGSWKIVGIATTLGSAALLAAGVVATQPRRLRPWWWAGIVAKGVSFGALNLAQDDFRFIIYDYGASMLLLLGLLLAAKPRRPGTHWIITGLLVAFIAAAIQRSRRSWHRHFNHNDLYHLVQMLAFHFLYTGARRETAP